MKSFQLHVRKLCTSDDKGHEVETHAKFQERCKRVLKELIDVNNYNVKELGSWPTDLVLEIPAWKDTFQSNQYQELVRIASTNRPVFITLHMDLGECNAN